MMIQIPFPAHTALKGQNLEVTNKGRNFNDVFQQNIVPYIYSLLLIRNKKRARKKSIHL
jgi:hypothetical protein